jgi:NAD dependent epimerase/dehydratase
MKFSGKRVLVTGADGFIGSHLVEQLVAAGARVRALVQYNSFNSRGWLDELPAADQCDVVAGDVRDAHFCHTLLHDMEVVFHLAALIPIPYSYLAPESFVDTNVRGTLHLCQAARAARVERFVQTSTSEVYGTARYVPMDEQHPLSAQSPYSATKIAADAMALSFFFSFGLPVVVARPFNTYGPRQSARAVIPSIVSQLAAGSREVRLGDLTTTRDFTFVEDTCRGLLAVASIDGAAGEVFNIGSNCEISIEEVFRTIVACMGVDAAAVHDDQRMRPAASEVRRLRCEGRKLELASGFRPAVSFAVGISRTVDWLSEPRNLGRYRSDVYSV